jgi:phosphoribosyl 1,2-cyclic phosphodiesterase
VQGLPFCAPLLAPGAELTVYGPADGERTFGEAFDQLMAPPFFPIRASQLSGDIRFATLGPGVVDIGGARVVVASVPHTGDTLGYRIERDGVAVVYVSDHQQPVDDPDHVDPAVLELCRGADLLIHDAQYTPEEFVLRSDWGHCTVDYAVHVAARAGVKALALFHHDPGHDDESVDLLSLAAAEAGRDRGVRNVYAAAEGMTLSVTRAPVRA